jgi:type I restriction enzyme S subunit
LLPTNTVCLSRTASVGYVVAMGRPMATSQDFVNWVCSGELDWRFLMYVLLAEKDSYRRFSHGTTHQTIYFPEVKAFHICLPPTREQRRIAGVLGALDDKIEHDRRLRQRLSRLLSLIFRGLLAGPCGANPLGDQVEVVMGQSPPGSSYSSERPGVPLVQGIGSFGERFPNADVFTSAPTKRTRPGDVLMTVRAPVGAINVVNGEYCAGRGVAILRGPRPAYTEQLMRYLEPLWRERETGTIYPSVNRAQIVSLPAPKPADAAIETFEVRARPVYDLIGALATEQARLSAIRDNLLPKLVSGAIRVPDSYDPDDALGTVAEAAGVAVP